MDVPWDEPATAMRYVRGLQRSRTDFRGNLKECVRFVMTQTNVEGNGYIVRLDDGSREWEGPKIKELWKDVSG